MPLPTCPSCGKAIGWKHSFSFWNPWDYPCPHCKTRLESSRIQKAIALGVVPVGVLVAGITLAFRQRGIWGDAESVVFVGLVAVGLAAAALASWPRTTFTIKRK